MDHRYRAIHQGKRGSRVSGGAKKGPKKGPKKVGVKKRKTRGGGFCIGNLHPFEDNVNSDDSSGGTVQALQQVQMPNMPAANDITGGSKKTGKSRKAGPYAKFVKKHFASVQKKNPKFKAPDCIKELAKMWKAQKK